MESIGNTPGGPTKGATGAQLVSSIYENYFALGKAFTYQDYHTMEAAEVLKFVFDPTVYDPPPNSQAKILGYFPSVFAEAGPILMDIHYGTAAADDGELQLIFNREPTILNDPASVLRLGPTISNEGTRFTGIGVPANAAGSGQQVSSSVEDQLPFALDISQKYLIKLTNQNGNDTLVTMRFTFFEI